MGFFSKLKQNLNHGGVKVRVDAPATVSLVDTAFDVKVTISNNGDTPQTIKQLMVGVKEDRMTQDNFGDPTARNMPSGPSTRDLETITNNETFVLNANETRTVTVKLPLKAAEILQEVAGNNSALNAAADILGKVETVAAAMNHDHYRHYVEASVDVEGIAFDPAAQVDVQFLKPGQVGAGINLHT